MKKSPSKQTFENLDPDDVIYRIVLPERRRFNPWMSASDLSWTDQVYSTCFPLSASGRHRFTFDRILLNLALSPEPISIFLDKSYYRTIRTRPAEFTPTNVGPICRLLKSKGYLALDKGYSFGKFGVSSTIRPTDKFLSIVPADLQPGIRREGLIVVKNFEPPEVYPKDVQESEDILYQYNPTTEPKNMLYAVYKGGFNVDGRFHGSEVISMPKDVRKNVRIENEKTFEADAKNCIPALLYAQEKRSECPGDAYDIPSVNRKLAKIAMLIMLNCTTRGKAVSALQGVVNFNIVEYGRHKADEILKALEQKHRAIRDCLYTGIGRQLMNVESGCMRRFLKTMLQKGIKVYPIYDAVVGKVSDEATIRDAFREAFTVNGVSLTIH